VADVLTLTGRIRNLSPTVWQVGSGPGRWSVAGYITRIGRRKQWVLELRTSPPDCRLPQNGELEFALPIDTRGLPAGIYEVWIDMLMDRRNWMALHGAVPVAAILRIETFSHETAGDADAVTLSPGGTAVLSGTLRNTCSKPWPEGAGGEPLKLGARLFRRSVKGEAVREFRALLEGLPETPEDAGESLLPSFHRHEPGEMHDSTAVLPATSRRPSPSRCRRIDARRAVPATTESLDLGR
jgi:hypothetical protein